MAKLTLAKNGYSDDSFGHTLMSDSKSVPLVQLLAHLIDYRGRTPRKLGMDWGGGEILALSANNVQMGGIDTSKEAYFGSEALYARWMTNGTTKLGDILMTLEAPLGNVAQVPDEEKYILSQRVVLLRFDESRFLNRFAYWYLQSQPLQKELVRNSTGTTASGIRRASLEKISVPVPSISEQCKIADTLFAFESKIAAEQRGLTKLRLQKQGLSSDLLTGRVLVVPENQS
ncbi:restriction endonuclease subunit S [Rhodococcus sp. NPDC078407]|uniref:restriction endonuclease subunit S n=1 Tax=Rhodococcus sp. NPDC078407 TaxID=3364509 RepID=UPI0037C7BCA4